MKNAVGSLGTYDRARQSPTQLGLDPTPAPTTKLGADYVRAAQSGRQSWSPNLIEAEGA